MSIYTSLIRPVLFRFDPEWIHHRALEVLAHAPAGLCLAAGSEAEDPVDMFGLRFRNRIGLAAGLDKNAAALAAWQHLGFGFVEIGTVTRHAQPGNPKPRVFRCPEEQGLINRMGFPNGGAEGVVPRLETFRARGRRPDFPVAANIGKSKATELADAAEDYLFSFRTLYALADFFVVNVSSPNTPGLRSLQQKDALGPILKALQEENRSRGGKPLLLKIAPDLQDREIGEILELLAEFRLDGIVATNTTIDHSSIRLRETGGLSGRPLARRSTEVIRFIARESGGKLPIIGVGGIFTREDYLEKLEAGASLVEVYTGFVYRGPGLVGELLKKDMA
jgi:dihydroorotate dehydrogenase